MGKSKSTESEEECEEEEADEGKHDSSICDTYGVDSGSDLPCVSIVICHRAYNIPYTYPS